MTTHIVGTSKPVSLATLGGNKIKHQENPARQEILKSGVFAVVSKGFSSQLLGYKSNKSKSGKGTMYACFDSSAKAYQFVKKNSMRLYATVVEF